MGGRDLLDGQGRGRDGFVFGGVSPKARTEEFLFHLRLLWQAICTEQTGEHEPAVQVAAACVPSIPLYLFS